MSSRMLRNVCAVLGVVCLTAAVLAAPTTSAAAEVGPELRSGGPLTFGPDDVLFIADNMGAAIFALEMGDRLSGGAPGTKNIPGIDPKDCGVARHRRPRDHDSTIWPLTPSPGTPSSRCRAGAEATPCPRCCVSMALGRST